MIDTAAGRVLVANIMSDQDVSSEMKLVRLLGFIADAACDAIDELRAIKEAGERETLPPPCPSCQGINFHLVSCTHYIPAIEGARDPSFLPDVISQEARGG